jgi:hypothetical protein
VISPQLTDTLNGTPTLCTPRERKYMGPTTGNCGRMTKMVFEPLFFSEKSADPGYNAVFSSRPMALAKDSDGFLWTLLKVP